jgi:low temperature requirement protein LtrA
MAVHRGDGDERVTPLELFFDLVFVLAVTQCSTLMARQPGWAGLGKGLLVLGVLWWAWVGYAWFTSVLDPEEGFVRGAVFVVIAAFLVAALAVPHAFVDEGLTFALAYAVVRLGHLALFWVASRDEPGLRRSVLVGLVPSTSVGVALIAVASQTHGAAQVGLWAASLALDVAGPFVFGSEGWQLVPGHFAERHGLIVLIALGESIVAIGHGSGEHLTGGVVAAAVIAAACSAGIWWVHFDLASLMIQRDLVAATPGREQNELARDVYSLLHLVLVAGIVLLAYGLKETLHDIDAPLPTDGTGALLGGIALYLLGHVAVGLRASHRVKRQRLVVAVLLLALVPVVHDLDAIWVLAIATALLWAMVAFETTRYAQVRDDVRHVGRAGPPA